MGNHRHDSPSDDERATGKSGRHDTPSDGEEDIKPAVDFKGEHRAEIVGMDGEQELDSIKDHIPRDQRHDGVKTESMAVKVKQEVVVKDEFGRDRRVERSRSRSGGRDRSPRRSRSRSVER
eukprot:32862-Hanusia_phi.AAC.2